MPLLSGLSPSPLRPLRGRSRGGTALQAICALLAPGARPPAPAGGRSAECPDPRRSHRASGQLRDVAPDPCRPAQQGQQPPRLLRCGRRGRARWGGGATRPGRAPRAGALCGPRCRSGSGPGRAAAFRTRGDPGLGRAGRCPAGWERIAPAGGGGGQLRRERASPRGSPARANRPEEHGEKGNMAAQALGRAVPGVMPRGYAGVGAHPPGLPPCRPFPWQPALPIHPRSRSCPRVRPRRAPRAALCRARPRSQPLPTPSPGAPPWPGPAAARRALPACRAGGGGCAVKARGNWQPWFTLPRQCCQRSFKNLGKRSK